MQEATQTDHLDHGSDPEFQAYYEHKDASPALRAHFLRIRDRVLALLADQFPGKKCFQVLDIGCNAGAQARLWATLGHRTYGLDVNGPLLEVARKRALSEGLEIQFDLGTATQLPYPDESMDACLMLELLEHVVDWETCMGEAVRVLKPGGVIYLSTTNTLCPKQHEFNLPLYSWYPAVLKRRYELKAVTTRPELVNHARYPAVNWFTFYRLRSYLSELGLDCQDRFDFIEERKLGRGGRLAVWALRNLGVVRLLGHLVTPGTIVVAVKRP